MGLKLTPKVGGLAVYNGMAVTIKELLGSEQMMVDCGDDGGILEVSAGQLLLLANPKDVLAKIPAATIDNLTWTAADNRATILREALLQKDGRKAAMQKAAEQLNISERHVCRLLKSLKQTDSVCSMIPIASGRKSGCRMLSPEKEKVIAETINEFFFVRERPTIKELFKRVVSACIAEGLDPPVYETVVTRVNAQTNRKMSQKREGEKKTRESFDAYPGHVEVTAPLERVEIDHTPMDVMAISDDPLCEYVGRPWLSIAIDVYTRCILGIYITFEPPSMLSVAMCIVNVLEEKDPERDYGVPLSWPMHGKPKEFVCDNAKDFDSNALARACKDLDIILYFRPKGSPHYGGTIERLIGTMVGKCHLLPGTTKNSIRAKGDYNSKEHAVMKLSELRKWFLEQALGDYHINEHRMLRIPPAEAWRIAKESKA